MTDNILYHYTNQEGFLGIFSSKTLWATKIHNLNDTKEFNHAIELVNTAVWHISKAQKENWQANLFEKLKCRLDGISKLHIYVSSVSEEGDILSQWRGYCPKGGISIGFNRVHLMKICNDQGFSLKPCIYEYSQQKSIIEKLIIELIKNIVKLSESRNIDEAMKLGIDKFLPNFIQVSPTLKDSSFSEEKEWRIISFPLRMDDSRCRFRPGNPSLIPYLEVKLLDSGGKFPVNRICIGPTSDNELALDSVTHFLIHQRIDFQVSISRIPYRNG